MVCYLTDNKGQRGGQIGSGQYVFVSELRQGGEAS